MGDDPPQVSGNIVYVSLPSVTNEESSLAFDPYDPKFEAPSLNILPISTAVCEYLIFYALDSLQFSEFPHDFNVIYSYHSELQTEWFLGIRESEYEAIQRRETSYLQIPILSSKEV